MTYFGNGNYTIRARSGREYLVTYSGRRLNSSVFAPGQWSPPSGAFGLSWYPGSGISLGGGSSRWVDLKARWVVARQESGLLRDARAWRYVSRKAHISGTSE